MVAGTRSSRLEKFRHRDAGALRCASRLAFLRRRCAIRPHLGCRRRHGRSARHGRLGGDHDRPGARAAHESSLVRLSSGLPAHARRNHLSRRGFHSGARGGEHRQQPSLHDSRLHARRHFDFRHPVARRAHWCRLEVRHAGAHFRRAAGACRTRAAQREADLAVIFACWS